MGTAQYKNAAITLKAKGISNELWNFVLAQGAQKLSAKEEIFSLFYYGNYTFRI